MPTDLRCVNQGREKGQSSIILKAECALSIFESHNTVNVNSLITLYSSTPWKFPLNYFKGSYIIWLLSHLTGFH